jgi:hypothetical protein
MTVAASNLALPLVVQPLPGEAAIGFVSRLAAKNGISFVALMEDVGDRRHPDNWEDGHWQRLAGRAFIEVRTLDPLRTRPLTSGRKVKTVTFLGSAIRAGHLLAQRMRLCPLCIAEGGVHREIWRLVHAVACLEHQVMLVDTCHCDRPIHPIWRGKNEDSCPCGMAFSEIAAPPASEASLDCMRWLVQLFGLVPTVTHPRLWFDLPALPEPFAPLSRTVPQEVASFDGQDLGPASVFKPLEESVPMHPMDALGIIDLVGRVVTVDATDDRPRKATNTTWRAGRYKGQGDLATDLATVEAAMPVIQGWPETWHSLLDEVASRAPIEPAVTPKDLFTTEVGSLILHPFKGHDDRPIDVIVKETDRWLTGRGIAIRRRRLTRISGTARRLNRAMPLIRAAERLGLDRGRPGVRKAYLRAVKRIDRRGSGDMTDQELAQAVLDDMRAAFTFAEDHVSLNVLGAVLNGPGSASAGRIWVHPDLILPVGHESTVNGRWRSPVFARADVERLKAKMAEVAVPVTADTIPEGYKPYAIVSKTTSSEAYPASLFIIDILAGRIPAARIVSEPTLSDLFLHAETARRFSLAGRIRRIVESDHFAAPYYIEKVLALLWPSRGEKLEFQLNRRLRETCAVRSIAKQNTTQGRTRPIYWYSTVDHLLRGREMFGPCSAAEVDAVLAEAGSARSRTLRAA